MFDNYDFETEILAASIRNTVHVQEAALWGADCATIPPAVFDALFKHPLTEKGLELFAKDWASTGQSIL
jgi:transaldolase